MINVINELAMEVLHARIKDGAFQDFSVHMAGLMSELSFCYLLSESIFFPGMCTYAACHLVSAVSEKMRERNLSGKMIPNFFILL